LLHAIMLSPRVWGYSKALRETRGIHRGTE
jgi:hypothetical protein